MKYACRALVEWHLMGENKVLRAKSLQGLLCAPQILHGLLLNWTLTCLMRGQWWTSQAIAHNKNGGGGGHDDDSNNTNKRYNCKAPPIPNLNLGGEWSALCLGYFIPLGKEPPVPIELQTRWTPELVWLLWRRGFLPLLRERLQFQSSSL